MPNKKRNLILALASMTLLASCGGGGDNDVSSGTGDAPDTTPSTSVEPPVIEDFDPNEPVEITFWHTMGKTPGQETLDMQIQRFNEIYPNITINHTQQGGYDEINKIINENLATGNLPTMAYCYEDHVAGYIDHNAVLDMTPYVEHPTYGLGHNPEGRDLGDLGVEDMTKGYWEAGANYEIEGHYSFPFSKSTEALFYNKTVFDQNGWTVPKTWPEMWALCEEIMANPVYSGNPDFYCLGYDSDANLLINSFAQQGLPYTTPQKGPSGTHFAFNTPENREFVKTLKGHFDNHYLVTKGSSANSAYTSNLFTAGTCLMSIGSTGGTSYNYTKNFEVGVAGVPQEDLNDPKMISQGPSVCFFKRGSSKQQRMAAWLFYKYLTNTENSAYFAYRSGYNPVRDSSYKNKFLTTELENATGAEGLIRDVHKFIGDERNGYAAGQFTSPAFKGSAAARKEMDGLLAAVLLGTKDVDKAFDDAFSNCLFQE